MDTDTIFFNVYKRYAIIVSIKFDKNCLQLKFLINKTILLEAIIFFVFMLF